MDYAISMYKPGERVYPQDCDFNSSSELGLLCPICKQEVYLRKGDIKKPYFAHFHATNSRQVKQCILRVSSDKNAIEISKFIEDRGQRLKIFKQQFLSMFFWGTKKIVDDVNFKYWINSIKDDNNQAINKIIEDCIDYLIVHQQMMKDKYIIHPTKIKNQKIMLQQQIALEAMDYLCGNAKFNFNLQYLLYYSIYQLYRHKQDITKKEINEICHFVTRIVMLNSWLKAFDNVTNNQENKPKIIRINKSKILVTSAHLPIPFLCYGGKKLDRVIRYTLEVTNTKPFELTVFYHSSRNRKNEIINNKAEVVKMSAGIGYLKATFKVIPLEKQLIFSSLVDDKEINFNFHDKVVKNLALPYWIQNAAQYVSLNELAPVWLVISKLWLKANYENDTDNSTIDETIQPQTFTELQWWEALIESANLLPNCVTLQNALKKIPEEYQQLLADISIR
jgi:hypothetical protein